MILIVDDHPDICRAVQMMLGLQGIPAECVSDPHAAIGAIRSLKPKMLILDQMMPGLLGTDLLKSIRSIPDLAAIPAVFYSASTTGEDEARQLGAADWLVKGHTDWDTLLNRIVEVYRALPADVQPRHHS